MVSDRTTPRQTYAARQLPEIPMILGSKDKSAPPGPTAGEASRSHGYR
jgi:hypothetical protein